MYDRGTIVYLQTSMMYVGGPNKVSTTSFVTLRNDLQTTS